MNQLIQTLASFVGVALLLPLGGGCDAQNQAASAAGRGSETAAKSVAAVDTQAQAGVSAPAGAVTSVPGIRDVVVNQFGIPAKVLPIRHGARCVQQPEQPVAAGLAARFFTPFFVFDTSPADGPPRYYKIGPTPRSDSIAGWIDASVVVRWDTRVGARYVRSSTTRVPPLLVYRDKDALIELLKTGNTGAEPIARAVSPADRSWMPWPITDSAQVTVDGIAHDLVKLAFLAEFKEGVELTPDTTPTTQPGSYSEAQFATMQAGARMLDVVFCMDSTGSMQPFIESAKSVVATMAQEFTHLSFRPDLAFGLVAYRDHCESGFVTRVFDLDRDSDRFLSRIADLRADAGGDVVEAVYDGVYDACEKISWRGGGLSTRVIVLIGDCSAHEPGDPQNPRNISRDHLVSLATRPDRHIKLFALAVGGRSGHPDRERRWEQFSDLANRTGGSCVTIEEAAAVVARVSAIVQRETTNVRTNSVVLEDLREGKSIPEIARTRELEGERVHEVMELLRGAGYDPERLGPGVPTFLEGWALADFAGTPILEREVYLARGEVDTLLAALNLLCTDLGSDLAAKLFAAGADGRTSPTQFLAEFFTGRLGDMPLEVALLSAGIPAGRTSVLRLSKAEILHMPEVKRQALRDLISGRLVPQLNNARNDDSLWRFRDDVEYGWLAENLLP